MSKEQRDDLVSSQGHSMTWKRYHRYGGTTTCRTWRFPYFIIPIFKHPLVTSIRIFLKFHVRKTWILAKQTHNSFSLNFSNKGNFQREYDPLVPSSPSTVLNLLLPFLPSSYTISQAISPHYSPLQDNNIPVRWIHKNSRALRRALQRF